MKEMNEQSEMVCEFPAIDNTLGTLLAALLKCGARVTGSFARGEQHLGSDIDLYIPWSKWERCAKLLQSTAEANGWKLHSPFIRCLSTRDSSTMLELSCLFDKTPKDLKLDAVKFGNLTFKTH